jgi:hypothetical protein
MSTKERLRKIDDALAEQASQLGKLRETVRTIGSHPTATVPEKNRTSWVSLIAIVISVLSLGFSFLQWRTATKALHVSQRAYVQVGDVTISCSACERPIEAPQKFPVEANAAIIVNLLNYGKTPANNLKLNVTQLSQFHTLASDFDFSEDAGGDSQPFTLPPDPNSPLRIVIPERAEVILSARHQIATQRGPNGEVADEQFYIYGHFTFDDTFEDAHTVLYCRRFIPGSIALPEHWERCGPHEGEVEFFVPVKTSHAPGFSLPKFYPPEPPDNRPPELRQAPLRP